MTFTLAASRRLIHLRKVTGGYTCGFNGKTYDVYKLESGEWQLKNEHDPYDYSDPIPTLKACREALAQMQLREHRAAVAHESAMETTFGVDPDWNTRAPEETPRDISQSAIESLYEQRELEREFIADTRRGTSVGRHSDGSVYDEENTVSDLTFDGHGDALVSDSPDAADDLSGVVSSSGDVNEPTLPDLEPGEIAFLRMVQGSRKGKAGRFITPRIPATTLPRVC